MKVELTHKEANLLMAFIWELGEEGHPVLGDDFMGGPMWRLTPKGKDLARRIGDKLEDANDRAERESGKGRDLSGAPKGSTQDARWEA